MLKSLQLYILQRINCSLTVQLQIIQSIKETKIKYMIKYTVLKKEKIFFVNILLSVTRYTRLIIFLNL